MDDSISGKITIQQIETMPVSTITDETLIYCNPINSQDRLYKQWKIDNYVHVFELQDIMNARSQENWELYKLMEHKTRNDTDVVTLIWEKW